MDINKNIVQTICYMKSKFGNKESIMKGEREPIGYYRHNGPKPIVNTRRDFETASYSETTEIPPGIYPIYPGWRVDGRNGGEATLYIQFKGEVTHDFFPSSFGGVIVGDTKPKHIGEPRTITQGLNVAHAIKSTGNSPNGPNGTPNKEGEIAPDIYINPDCWEDIKRYYEKVLAEDIKYFKSNIEKLENGEKSLDDLTGTIKYCAACIQHVSETLGVIQESQKYLQTPTSASANLRKKNTSWIPQPSVEQKEGKIKAQKQSEPELS